MKYETINKLLNKIENETQTSLKMKMKRKENKVAILRRAERSMVRAMCNVKLVDKRNAVKLMDILGLKKAGNKLARVNCVGWYGHVLRQPEEDVLMKAMLHKVDRKHKQGQPWMKWREQVEGNMRKIGLR